VTDSRLRAIGRVLAEQTTESMVASATKHQLLVDDRIDLRGATIRFQHTGLDLRRFAMDGANLGASRLINCAGAGVSFRECTLHGAWIAAGPGVKVSFAGACFEGAMLTDVTFGPRTLDLRGVSFRRARLKDVTFRMGLLEGAVFSAANLEDVYFRSGQLQGVDFSDARLCRVSFEKADINGISLLGAKLEQMDFWGHQDLEVGSSGQH
jgi:uncharacterized protein YjbI with pentapeptide repeats